MNLPILLIHHPILAGLYQPFTLALTIPLVGGLAFAFLVIGVAAYFRNKEDQRRHDTARLALEKGQPIPNFGEPWARSCAPAAPQKSWVGLMIGGLINIAVGIGLYFMLCTIPGAYVARYCGVIPGLVGVALLVSSLIVALFSRTKSDAGGPPPSS